MYSSENRKDTTRHETTRNESCDRSVSSRCTNFWHTLASVAVLIWSASVSAEFQPEPLGRIETLPAQYPDHWVMIHDISFFHMQEGKVLVVDPLANDLGSQFKGTMTASFIGAYEKSRTRNEHYVIETFYSRGGRGGERSDVVSIYDPTTLSVIDEVVIPAKRVTGVPKSTATGLIGTERFLGVYNFTPAQSVSIVDLDARSFVAEVSTPGCGFLFANGEHSFTSICANGSMLTSHLDDNGVLKSATRTPILFDAENDPIFEGNAVVGSIAYFPTFQGNVLPIDVRGEEINALDSWSLTAADEKNWRPGGVNPLIADTAGVGYFLMHPHGGEGTHKDGGSEVWAYDLAGGTRLNRVALTNWGLTLGTSGTGDNRLLFVTNSEMGVDVYRLPKLEFIHTLKVGAATPFVLHGAQ